VGFAEGVVVLGFEISGGRVIERGIQSTPFGMGGGGRGRQLKE
jgi:hypothetical protein